MKDTFDFWFQRSGRKLQFDIGIGWAVSLGVTILVALIGALR